MKFVIVFVALIAVCVARPAESEVDAVATKDNRDNNGIDNYQFDFETSNGISRQETGTLKTVDQENAAIVVSGVVSWTAPDGSAQKIEYTADETGYHASV